MKVTVKVPEIIPTKIILEMDEDEAKILQWFINRAFYNGMQPSLWSTIEGIERKLQEAIER
jgi:hypothetical protein